jgi:superoxide dismutase
MCSPAATGGPGGALKPAIEAAFGSVEAMRAEFSAAAASRFGSGWAWLVVAPDGSLKVTSTPNQDNTLMQVADVRGAPVLALDVWEHAYYLLRQNRRPEYIAAWWWAPRSPRCPWPNPRIPRNSQSTNRPAHPPPATRLKHGRNVVNWEQAEENYQAALAAA